VRKLWVFTSRYPYPIEKGDKLRLYFQLIELSAHFDITLFTLADKDPDEEHEQELQKYCSEIIYVRLSSLARMRQTFLAFTRRQPLQVGFFRSMRLQRIINHRYIEHPPDLIYCHLIRMSEYVRHLPVPKVLDYMDAFSLGMFRASANSNNFFWKHIYRVEAALCAYYERFIFSEFDYSTIISRQDQQALKILQKDSVTVVSNGIDIDQFYYEDQLERKEQILFIGNLGYAPNVRAAQYLINELMPRLWEKRPEARLLLAGARPTPWLKRIRDPRIELLGWVENIRDAYCQGAVFVAPLFTGSGMQNKILEAMSVGVPCITTEIVNDSILAKPERDILLAEDADRFIEQILLLFDQEEIFRRLSKNGRAFIENNFPWEKATQPLLRLLNKTIEIDNTPTYAK
jgi:sugar transferase (PEP-CTERM/EpsH1 system associated)